MNGKRTGFIVFTLGFLSLGIFSWWSFETERLRAFALFESNQELELESAALSLLAGLDGQILAIRNGAEHKLDSFVTVVVDRSGKLIRPEVLAPINVDDFLLGISSAEKILVQGVLSAIYVGKTDDAIARIRNAPGDTSEPTAALLRYHLANLFAKVGREDEARRTRLELLAKDSLRSLPSGVIADFLIRCVPGLRLKEEQGKLVDVAIATLVPVLSEPRDPAYLWLVELASLLKSTSPILQRNIHNSISTKLASLRLRSYLLREDYNGAEILAGGLGSSKSQVAFAWWGEESKNESRVEIHGLQPRFPTVFFTQLETAGISKFRVVDSSEIGGEPTYPLGFRGGGFFLTFAHVATPNIFPWRSLLVATFILFGMGILRFGWVREQKSLEEHRRNLDAKSRFLANVSHQLKTPVANLRLFAETLAGDHVDDEAERQRMLDILILESTRLGNFLHHIMGEARLDKAEFVPTLIDLNQMLTDRLPQWQETASLRGLQLKLNMTGDLPTICGDATSLLDGFDNVVENALSFSPDGGLVEIAAKVVDEHVEISVADQGPGIPESDRDRVFDRFYRGEHALARQGRGTGLGLHIAKVATDRAQGTLEILRTGVEGTTMLFRIPPGNGDEHV